VARRRRVPARQADEHRPHESRRDHDAAAAVLGVQDHLRPEDKTALHDYLTDGGANPTLDLFDYDIRNTKLHGLFALIMQSPAYQLH
jgi:hypothetical protein